MNGKTPYYDKGQNNNRPILPDGHAGHFMTLANWTRNVMTDETCNKSKYSSNQLWPCVFGERRVTRLIRTCTVT